MQPILSPGVTLYPGRATLSVALASPAHWTASFGAGLLTPAAFSAAAAGQGCVWPCGQGGTRSLTGSRRTEALSAQLPVDPRSQLVWRSPRSGGKNTQMALQPSPGPRVGMSFSTRSAFLTSTCHYRALTSPVCWHPFCTRTGE